MSARVEGIAKVIVMSMAIWNVLVSTLVAIGAIPWGGIHSSFMPLIVEGDSLTLGGHQQFNVSKRLSCVVTTM